MKHRNVKKLVLKKATVTNLDRMVLNQVFGGETTAPCIPSDPCAPTVMKQATCKDTCLCNNTVSYPTDCTDTFRPLTGLTVCNC